MRRREFIAAVVGVGAAALPFSASAQRGSRPVIGFLSAGSSAVFAPYVKAFLDGLASTGYSEPRNVVVEYRWANDQLGRIPEQAKELVERRVDVIVATAGVVPAQAAHATTRSIPIVFGIGTDPVAIGLVGSLNRPGGNATGATVFTADLEAKRIELLSELLPRGAAIGVFVNAASPSAATQSREVEDAGRKLGREIAIAQVSGATDFDAAFVGLIRRGAKAVAIASDPLFNNRRAELVGLAERHRLPAIYQFREYTTLGGLMSYGTNVASIYHLIGTYTGRILNGEKPADLPVVQPTRFELVINLKTAKTLGIEMPTALLVRADEVIE